MAENNVWLNYWKIDAGRLKGHGMAVPGLSADCSVSLMRGPPILFPAVDVMKQMFAVGEDAVWFCSNVDLVLLQFIVVVVYNGLNLIVSFRLEHCSNRRRG